MNYVVLLCIEFVILLIEEKVMSYVTSVRRSWVPTSWNIISLALVRKAPKKKESNNMSHCPSHLFKDSSLPSKVRVNIFDTALRGVVQPGTHENKALNVLRCTYIIVSWRKLKDCGVQSLYKHHRLHRDPICQMLSKYFSPSSPSWSLIG